MDEVFHDRQPGPGSLDDAFMFFVPWERWAVVIYRTVPHDGLARDVITRLYIRRSKR